MAKHIETGKKGEALAKQYLEERGYRILETNWRFSRAELDLIAMQQEVLVFIEVKTRSSDYFGTPDAFVDSKKEKLMAEAAAAYMRKINHDWEIRFDIISVLMRSEKDITIEHFKDAFFPGW